MKSIYISILTGVALCFGLLSCNDDFLERAPLIN
jgi:hypothetical protein